LQVRRVGLAQPLSFSVKYLAEQPFYFVHKFRNQVKGKYLAQVGLIFFRLFFSVFEQKERIGKIFLKIFDFCLDNFIYVK
jgi:hypothetical protein